ncbi:MAG: HAD hydrolase-like protein [Nitrosopumilus sp.]|nr:HAD hydrolase-like protein [Nitrosopumilus sp.]
MDFIRTGKSVFGKSHMIEKIIKQRKVSKREVFYVCDEVRDLEAAIKSGIKPVAVRGVQHQRYTQKKS